MERAFAAVSDPRRRDILRLLTHGERSAGQVAEKFPDVTRSAVSQHLSVLKDAGLVELRRDGTHRFYRASRRGIEELRRYLDSFWEQQLDNLKRAAAREETTRRGKRK